MSTKRKKTAYSIIIIIIMTMIMLMVVLITMKSELITTAITPGKHNHKNFYNLTWQISPKSQSSLIMSNNN